MSKNRFRAYLEDYVNRFSLVNFRIRSRTETGESIGSNYLLKSFRLVIIFRQHFCIQNEDSCDSGVTEFTFSLVTTDDR